MTPKPEKSSSELRENSGVEPGKKGEAASVNPFLNIIARIGRCLFLLAGEFTAIVLGLAFVWFYGLNVLLAKKIVDVSFLEANAGLWFSEAFDGKSASIQHMELSWRPERQAIVLDARNIEVEDEAGLSLQSIGHLGVAVDFGDALGAKLTPRYVDITGGAVTWLRDGAGNVVAGMGTPETVGRFNALPGGKGLEARTDQSGGFNMATLEGVTIRGAEVYVIDRTRGIDLRFPDTHVTLAKKASQFGLSLEAALEGGSDTGEISAKALFSADYEDFDLDVSLRGVNPRTVAPESGRAAILANFDLPVDLDLQVSAMRGKGLRTVTIDVKSGSGTGGLSPRTNRIKSIDIAANYDTITEALNIDTLRIDGTRFGGAGTARLTNIGRPATGFFKETVGFSSRATNVKFDATHLFDDIFEFKAVDITGSYAPIQKRLEIDDLVLGFDDFALGANISLTRGRDGKLQALSGGGRLTGDMTPGDLLSIWPTRFALGARRWVDRRVESGLISDLELDFDMPAAVFVGEKLRNEDLTLAFSVRDGRVKYISTMTPLTDAIGAGVLRGNSLEFEVTSGEIGSLDITRGQVDILRLFPKGGDLVIDVEGTGAATEMLALIDQKPFLFTSRYGLKPSDFSGQGHVHLNIRRPLLEYFDKSRIEYAVDGNFTDVSIPYSMGVHRLEKGDFSLKADSSGMTVKGPTNFGPWRTELEWKESFGTSGKPTQYRLAGKMDGNTLDGFGLGFREYFGGAADVVIEAEGKGLSIAHADVSVDLTGADLQAGSYWTKPPGVAGAVTGHVSRTAEGVLTLKNVDMQAPGLALSGRAAFAGDARLINFELETAKIETFIDASVKIAPNTANTAFDIDMSGAFLDISPVVNQTIRTNTGQAGLPMNLTASLDRLALDDMYVLRNAVMGIRHNGTGTEEARISGDVTGGGFLASLSPKADGKGRALRIEIPDAARATQAFLNMKSIKGGQFSLSASLPEVGVDGPLSGEVRVDDFALINAPIMAQILSLASLKGLTDAMGGSGLTFKHFEAPFSYNQGALSVRDARASGSALGLTGSGQIDFAGKTVDIDGVLVPAYSANSALSAIPVIGDIFVGKKGEGIFALNYSVKGPFSKTQVGVNPLSALTPGFLRRIFDTGREDLPQDAEKAQTPEDVPNPDNPR